jgi:hypothetical protein
VAASGKEENMSNRIPQADQQSSREMPMDAPTQRRRKRERADPKLYISFLPEGKGGPRDDKGSVPLEVDFEDHIEERSDCEPGLYRVEKKRSGEFSGDVKFYTKEEPDERAPIDDADEPDNVEAFAAAGASSADIARAVSAALDARDRRATGQPDPMEQFRQMRELLKEEREEMQRQLQDQASKQQPRDSLSDFERFLELQKRLTAEQAPRDDLSPDDRAQLMLVQKSGLIPEFMKSMREMLRAPEAASDPEGIVPSLLDFAKQALPYVGPTVGPILGQKLNELMSHVDVNALAQKLNNTPSAAASTGAQSVPPTDVRMAAYTRVMRRVVIDLVDNVPPDVAVAATVQFVNAYPELATQFDQIVNASSADVAAFILAQTREDVRALPHCDEWITGYQAKLRAAGSAESPGAVDSESNDDDDGPLTFDDVLRFVKQQLIEDQDPAAAVSSVVQLLAEQPDLAPTIHQLLATPNSELVAVLSQATQTDLTIIANAQSFIEKLKVGVKARLHVPVAVSSNGHNTSAEAAKV